ncbi:MAG: type II toxin-antitoxin system prevent-host-death family antitoxin [Terracidiphilus sp.]|jgi:prevent-host-death family protein
MPPEEGVYTEIGSFDAKTKLSEILRKVEQGERFTITRRGRAVADVVPTKARNQRAIDEAVEGLLNFPRIKGVPGETVLEWIREGRK